MKVPTYEQVRNISPRNPLEKFIKEYGECSLTQDLQPVIDFAEKEKEKEFLEATIELVTSFEKLKRSIEKL